MQAELEGLRIEVEQAEKARKQASAELQAANDKTNELMLVINDHSKEKRQLEMEVNSANAAVEEAINSARSADLAGKRAAQDAAKMAEQVNREVNYSFFVFENIIKIHVIHFQGFQKRKLGGKEKKVGSTIGPNGNQDPRARVWIIEGWQKIRDETRKMLKLVIFVVCDTIFETTQLVALSLKKFLTCEKEMDQRELENELKNMMKLHAEGIKQVKKMERVVRESDQRAKVSLCRKRKRASSFYLGR